MFGNKRKWAAAAAVASIAAAGTVVAQPGDTPPVARYYMDVDTVAGFMGQGDHRQLTLRLGSRNAPTGGAPKADHFMPAGAKLGASVPLETPVPGKNDGAGTMGAAGGFEQPKGRLLLYWGCGEHAGPGQPVVVDFAKMAKGQVPSGFLSTKAPSDPGPQAGNSRTYGSWPNGRDRKTVSAKSSLIGQHRIAGNYSPEIAFALDQDFMAGLKVRSAPGAGGSTALSWNAIGNATGYSAWVMGSKSMGEKGGDMVWWTSSATKEFGGGLWDWLAPATVKRLIGQKVVMPPSQTSCTVPAEVKQAAGETMMGFLYAYGPEADFAYPARPANAKAAWHPEWTAKVRYRSMANMMLGMPGMANMGERDAGEADTDRSAEKPKKCKPKLGGLLRSALTGGKGC